MAAVVNYNEPTAQSRSVEINVFALADSSPAPVDTDLAGYIYISQSTYKYIPATGTFDNKRHTLVLADDVIESVDTGDDEVVLTAHGYNHGDGPFVSDEVIGTIAIGDEIYIIVVDANTVAFAPTLADAYANNREALTGTETGATISDAPTTERGIPGVWNYTFPQAETVTDACELGIKVLGHATYIGGASVNVNRAGSSVWDAPGEDGHSMGDLVRGVARGELAPYGIDGNEHIIMSIDGTKESHRGTVTESGRSDMDIGDLSP